MLDRLRPKPFWEQGVDLAREFPCPDCGETLVHLTWQGRCPICEALVSARYVGLLAGAWVPACATEAELRAMLREPAFKLVYSLPWCDL